MLIEGRVQGVGFRATTRRIARDIGVEGLVRNLRDGRVEIFCEGTQEQIDELAARLRDLDRTVLGVRPRVENLSVYYENEDGYSPAWTSYSGFEVNHSMG